MAEADAVAIAVAVGPAKPRKDMNLVIAVWCVTGDVQIGWFNHRLCESGAHITLLSLNWERDDDELRKKIEEAMRLRDPDDKWNICWGSSRTAIVWNNFSGDIVDVDATGGLEPEELACEVQLFDVSLGENSAVAGRALRVAVAADRPGACFTDWPEWFTTEIATAQLTWLGGVLCGKPEPLGSIAARAAGVFFQAVKEEAPGSEASKRLLATSLLASSTTELAVAGNHNVEVGDLDKYKLFPLYLMAFGDVKD